MTALGKALFSLLLVGAGFGLASVFGPPDLADDLADQLTLGQPSDPWGDLRPAPPAADPNASWGYFAQSQADQLGIGARPLTASTEAPAFVPTPTAAPAWPTPAEVSSPALVATPGVIAPADYDAPPSLEIAAAATNPVQDKAVMPAAAQQEWMVGDRYAAPAKPLPPAMPTQPPAWPPQVGSQSQPAAQPVKPANSWQREAAQWSTETQGPTATLQPPSRPQAGAPMASVPQASTAQQAPAAFGAHSVPSQHVDDPAWRSASYRRAAPAVGAWEKAVSASQPGQRSMPYSEQAPAVASLPTQPTGFPEWQASSVNSSAASQNLPSVPAAATVPEWAPALTPVHDSSQPLAPREEVYIPPRTHLVADGDTLAKLAHRYLGDPSRAVDIYEWNKHKLPHPDLLPIGVELQIERSATTSATTHEAAYQRSTQPEAMVPVSSQPRWQNAAPRARLMGPQPTGVANAYPR